MSDEGDRRRSQSVSLQDTFSIAQPRMRWGSSTLLCKVFICDAARAHFIRVLICCYRDVYSFNSQCVFNLPCLCHKSRDSQAWGESQDKQVPQALVYVQQKISTTYRIIVESADSVTTLNSYSFLPSVCIYFVILTGYLLLPKTNFGWTDCNCGNPFRVQGYSGAVGLTGRRGHFGERV